MKSYNIGYTSLFCVQCTVPYAIKTTFYRKTGREWWIDGNQLTTLLSPLSSHFFTLYYSNSMIIKNKDELLRPQHRAF